LVVLLVVAVLEEPPLFLLAVLAVLAELAAPLRHRVWIGSEGGRSRHDLSRAHAVRVVPAEICTLDGMLRESAEAHGLTLEVSVWRAPRRRQRGIEMAPRPHRWHTASFGLRVFVGGVRGESAVGIGPSPLVVDPVGRDHPSACGVSMASMPDSVPWWPRPPQRHIVAVRRSVCFLHIGGVDEAAFHNEIIDEFVESLMVFRWAQSQPNEIIVNVRRMPEAVGRGLRAAAGFQVEAIESEPLPQLTLLLFGHLLRTSFFVRPPVVTEGPIHSVS